MAGSAINEDALCVKWFVLLPAAVVRSLKVVTFSPLDKLAVLTEDLMNVDSTDVVAVNSVALVSANPTINLFAEDVKSLCTAVA